MTTESSKNGAIALSRMNFSGGHGTRRPIYLNAYHSMMASSRVRVRVRFNVWL